MGNFTQQPLKSLVISTIVIKIYLSELFVFTHLLLFCNIFHILHAEIKQMQEEVQMGMTRGLQWFISR